MEKHYISEIVVNSFRNYFNKKIEFKSDFNIIVGPNGIGKTNILEALSLFSNSRGLRNANIDELVNINNKIEKKNIIPNEKQILFSLFIKFFDYTKNEILILQREDKKLIKYNNEILKSANLLTDLLKISWLTPQMDNFFIDASSERRKFIDKTAEMLFINHCENVKKYEFFLKERMKILTTQTIRDKWLDIVERKIVQLGTSIASVRNQVVDYLNEIFENQTKNFPIGNIKIDGDVEKLIEEKKSVEVENFYSKTLFENRVEDARMKRTNFGIHRSDVKVINKEKNIDASLCSTGEQKMLLISLIIVKALFSKKIDKGIPILLLDEICSHIDKNTKQKLFDELLKMNIQIFLTGINENDFIGLNDNFIRL